MSTKNITPEQEYQRKIEVSKAIQGGDVTAFELFVQETQGRAIMFPQFVYRFNLQDAEDLTQQAYYELLRKIINTPVGGIINIYALFWCYLHHRCLNLYKQKNRERKHTIYPAGNKTDEEEPNLLDNVPEENCEFLPESALINADKRRIIMQAVSELPEAQRETFVHRYLCDQSISDTAQALGKSPGTVKAQTYAAIQKIQKSIGESSQFYALVGLPVLTRIFEQEALDGGYALSAGALSGLLASTTQATATAATATAATATTATTATAATATTAAVATTTAAASATTTAITIGGLAMKFTAMTVAAKTAIVVGLVAVVTVGVSVPVYVHGENVKADQAAIVEQQRVEEAVRLDAEQSAQEAAEKLRAEKAEAEAMAIKEAKATKLEAEKAEALRLEAEVKAREAEAEAIRLEAEAKDQAEVKAKEEAAKAQENTGTKPPVVSSKPSGSKSDAWQPAPGESRPDDDIFTSKPAGSGGSKEGATSGPMVGGGGGTLTMQQRLDIFGKKWQGQAEPSNHKIPSHILEDSGYEWDSAVGGWQNDRGKYLFPDGNGVDPN